MFQGSFHMELRLSMNQWPPGLGKVVVYFFKAMISVLDFYNTVNVPDVRPLDVDLLRLNTPMHVNNVS
jgi:hypothetical protein